MRTCSRRVPWRTSGSGTQRPIRSCCASTCPTLSVTRWRSRGTERASSAVTGNHAIGNLGPVYSERQRQHCENPTLILAIQRSSSKMGCNPILEHHRRVVTVMTLTFGVNGPLVTESVNVNKPLRFQWRIQDFPDKDSRKLHENKRNETKSGLACFPCTFLLIVCSYWPRPWLRQKRRPMELGSIIMFEGVYTEFRSRLMQISSGSVHILLVSVSVSVWASVNEP